MVHSPLSIDVASNDGPSKRNDGASNRKDPPWRRSKAAQPSPPTQPQSLGIAADAGAENGVSASPYGSSNGHTPEPSSPLPSPAAAVKRATPADDSDIAEAFVQVCTPRYRDEGNAFKIYKELVKRAGLELPFTEAHLSDPGCAFEWQRLEHTRSNKAAFELRRHRCGIRCIRVHHSWRASSAL